MADMIAIVGKSGTGKTTSLFPNEAIGIKGLPPEECLLINVAGKELTFPKSRKLFKKGKFSEGAHNIFESNPKKVAGMIRMIDRGKLVNKDGVEKIVKTDHIKYIIVEDAQYLQLFMFMDKISEKGFDKFNDVGEAAFLPLKAAMNALREDLTIIFIYHSEETNSGDSKIKTAGKLVDAYLTIEGLFSTVLYTQSVMNHVDKKLEFSFLTQNNGYNTAKSPAGMFDELIIPNDMGYVIQKMKEYYE